LPAAFAVSGFLTECPAGTGLGLQLPALGFGQTNLEELFLNQTCHAVRVGLVFDGPGGAAGDNPVAVELLAAFRNVVLGRLQWSAVPGP
jgi:hypothetical protein